SRGAHGRKKDEPAIRGNCHWRRQSGPCLALQLANAHQTAIIKRKRFGGTCAHTEAFCHFDRKCQESDQNDRSRCGTLSGKMHCRLCGTTIARQEKQMAGIDDFEKKQKDSATFVISAQIKRMEPQEFDALERT